MKRPLYLDHHSTTPLDPKALEAMIPYFQEDFGNASSQTHSFGWNASQAVEKSRDQLAEFLNCSPKEVYFTSGGTESNALAIRGFIEAHEGQKLHLVTSNAEHKAVLDIFESISPKKHDVTVLPVNPEGNVTAKQVEESLKPHTALVSLIYGNNEIGSLNPVEEIGELLKAKKITFHVDAVQAASLIPLDLEKLNIDLLTLSSHKIYGPKGAGLLYVRKRHPRIHLEPLFAGGGQEKGLRGGTLNVPAIVGFGAAALIAAQMRSSESLRLKTIRDELSRELIQSLGVKINGHPTLRLPHNLNFTIPGITQDTLLPHLFKTLALSTGSACSSALANPSHVLKAIGLTDDEARSTLRIGLGRSTQKEDIKTIVNSITSAVNLIKGTTSQ